jgi:dihydroorotate dehydrogenase (NAD+) catalytic subunit
VKGRPEPARVRRIYSEGDYKTIEIEAREVAREAYPGGFLMLWVPGVDEIPLAIASSYGDSIELMISPPRGKTTNALYNMSVGELVGVRGPFGRPLPNNGSNVLLVGSSYGISYLRFYFERHREKVRRVILVDAGRGIPYVGTFLRGNADLVIARDAEELLKAFYRSLEESDLAIICVEEAIGRRLAETLVSKHVKGYLCVERPIKCGLGLCGSCDIGIYRTCMEGIFIDASSLINTEYGFWTRDKSGSRVPIHSSAGEAPELPYRIVERDPELSIEISGILFPNPLMNASGCGLSGRILYRFALEGAGAVVTKSIGLEPRRGFRGPVLIEDPRLIYINALGLPNPGVDRYIAEIIDAKRAGVPVIASIFGRDPAEYVEVAKKIYMAGVDAIELNISCPHTEFEMVEDIPELVRDVVKSVKRVVKIPVFVKISANSDYIDVVRKAVEGGVDGITAINTLRGYIYDPVFRKPLLGSPKGYGGVSGPSLKPIVRRVIADIRGVTRVPIIAAGGIDSVRDIVELSMLGAKGFQICSAIAYKGFNIFREILNDLRNYLRSIGVRSLEELIRSTRSVG